MPTMPSRISATELTLSVLSGSGRQAVANRCTGYTSRCDGEDPRLVEDRTGSPYRNRRLCDSCFDVLEAMGGIFVPLTEPQYLARARAGLLPAWARTGDDAA